MFKKVSRSVVFRISVMMISVILMAFTSIFSSMYMSQLSEFDGAAINLSGSMRMKSYQLTTEVALYQQTKQQNHHQTVLTLIDEFEHSFNNPLLQKDFSSDQLTEQKYDYSQIKAQWQTIVKPLILNSLTQESVSPVIAPLTNFVTSLDNLVLGYQSIFEKRLTTLRLIQISTLFVTLLFVCLSLYSIHQHIALPLKELTDVARKSSRGDLTQRFTVIREDELGLLATTFNNYNQRIARIYGDLEQRVERKTQELKRSNQILTLLYQVAQEVNESRAGELNYNRVIHQVSEVSGLSNIDLCLLTPEGDVPYQHILTETGRTQSQNCEHKECGECLSGETAIVTLVDQHQVLQHRYVIEKSGLHYGIIVVTLEPESKIQLWQQQLLKSVAEQLALALSMRNQRDQQRRITLLNERSIIARELHDSLAQSLSYLKIQVTRIQRAINNYPEDAKLTSPVTELKEGLNSAYRQLRELLTTFRLHIDSEGLECAVLQTIQTLAKRSDIDISLNYKTAHIPFTPNEEIHLLQITKEALQNAINHSQGTEIFIHFIEQDDQQVKVVIADNGIGIDDKQHELNHYGTIIMQERSHSLGGEFLLVNRPEGGAQVTFSFYPQYLNKAERKMPSEV